jgi:hypothetical protein
VLRLAVEHILEEALLEKYRGSANPLEKTFAALMLDYANGCRWTCGKLSRFFPFSLPTAATALGSEWTST